MNNTIEIIINWTDPTFFDQYTQSKLVDLDEIEHKNLPKEILLVGDYKVTIEKMKGKSNESNN